MLIIDYYQYWILVYPHAMLDGWRDILYEYAFLGSYIQ